LDKARLAPPGRIAVVGVVTPLPRTSSSRDCALDCVRTGIGVDGFGGSLETAGLEGVLKAPTVGLPSAAAGAFEGDPGRGKDGRGFPFVCGVCTRDAGPTV
jgi:hypothetical protein